MNNRKALRLAICFAAALALMCAPALAKVVSAGTDFFYLDNANVMSEALEGEIYFCNQLLDKACGAQIVVVTIDTTGTEAIDDYAYDLFNKWRIGDQKQQNGLLILLAIGDDNYYVLPGTGLESRFSAGYIGEYVDEYLEPNFASGDYEAAVKKFFEAVFARVADTYDANVTVSQGVDAYKKFVAANSESDSFGGYEWTGGHARGDESEESGGSAMLGFVIVLIIILVVVMAKRNSRRRAVRRPIVSDDTATMIMADQLLRNASRTARPPHIIPTRTAPGYRPFSFGAPSTPRSSRPTVSRPSSGFSGGGLFGGGSSSSSRSSGGSHFGGFGGGHGGGGGTRGGGVGRGRH